jgi:hypothetical protein
MMMVKSEKGALCQEETVREFPKTRRGAAGGVRITRHELKMSAASAATKEKNNRKLFFNYKIDEVGGGGGETVCVVVGVTRRTR